MISLPPIGTQIRDVSGIIWDVVAHETGRARLAATADPDITRWATVERLADFARVEGRR